MNPGPIQATPLEDYKLLITFQNNEKKIFDMKPMLKQPIYNKLTNKGLFSLAKADGMCVYWNDELDLCPDMVYNNSLPVKDT